MQSAIDISQENVKLLSSYDLEEVLELLATIVMRDLSPAALAILMWDADLESFGDLPVFGARKKDFAKFVGDFAKHFDPAEHRDGEIDTDDFDGDMPADLEPVSAYAIKDGDTLHALILLAGSPAKPEEATAFLEARPVDKALGHAWEYRELRRENERLRGQYEMLEDKTFALEEQTRKLIHDVTAKEMLHTKKVELDRLVYGISNAVRSSLKIQEVLDNAVNQIGSSFGVTHCLLLRPVQNLEELLVYEYHNPLQNAVSELFRTEAGLKFMRTALTKEAPQDLGDPNQDEQSSFDRDFLRQLGLRSGVLVPLILREHVLGVLYLQECLSPREWSIDDTALLGSLADLLCVAIENADLHEERERQAVTDGLTGVANRRHFNDMFTREFERARRYDQPLALIIADLDFLKKVNDTYGHQAGDEAIKAIAKVMRESSRSIDLAARYGGEEFCLLLPNTDLEMAGQIAERIRKLINEQTLDGPGAISASVGVAGFPTHATEAEELFQQADAALYRAKQEGRNRVCVATDKNAKTP